LQGRIVRALAPLSPPWTLTGGGALAGAYLGHRTTRDLDLFWRERHSLGNTPLDAQALLRATGLDVVALRTSPTFAELRVSDETDACIVDLVAEPFASLEPPVSLPVDGTTVQVDSLHEILVNKLTTLLGRAEVRDLVDVRALLEAGLDLAAGVRDAPKKDGGFSALTLAWVLTSLDVEPLARELGSSAEAAKALAGFKSELVDSLMRIARPE
jgi:hypothetical protein